MTFYGHHKHKLVVTEIQGIIVAIQAKPVEIQVNVVQLHLSSEEIHCSKYSIQGFERVPQVSVGWKALICIFPRWSQNKGQNHNFCTTEQEMRSILSIYTNLGLF